MTSAIDVAKFFIKSDPAAYQNTLEGNIKLQKMLFFADLISLAERQERLFPEPIRAFEHGCVVEEVRFRFKDEYENLRRESVEFTPSFSDSEYTVLNLTTEIFSNISASELSELNHALSCWEKHYRRSQDASGYCNKDVAVIPTEELLLEAERIKPVLAVYRARRNDGLQETTIHGVTFSFARDFQMSDMIIKDLEEFARMADEKAYGVYLDEGDLVIY